MSKNDITGDSIRSKPLSKEAEDNWDRIFHKKKLDYEYELNKSTGEVEKRFKDGVSKPNGEQFNDE
jgi:hypothetical protein